MKHPFKKIARKAGVSRLARFGAPALVFLCAIAGAGQKKHPPAPATAPREAAAEQVPNFHLQAARENAVGVALMNRQQFSDALGHFQRSCIMDAQSNIPCMNMGIALFNMQRYDDATRVLSKAAQLEPTNPHAWYNLGLIGKAEGKSDAAIANFEKVEQIDPDDPDTHYFLGLLYAEQQQYQKAIPQFETALKLNPFHLSAEFGLAQALLRSGHREEAKTHLARFEQMNAQKLGSPISFTYGDQGKYSLSEEMIPGPEPIPAPTPVHFVDVTAESGLPTRRGGPPERRERTKNETVRDSTGYSQDASRATAPAAAAAASPSLEQFLGAGACVIDYDGDGKPDVFLLDANGNGFAGLYRNLGNGKFENVTGEAHLELYGQATSCAVGDYDNDGRPDLAVAINRRVHLFHNEGNGTFRDVTDASGIDTEGLILGMTFIDFDHDGDLDLYVTRFNDFPLSRPGQPFTFPSNLPGPGNVLWRNDGNGKFTNWTKQAGMAGTSGSVAAIGSDINNDRAIDFVVTNWHESPTIFLNPREGEFHPVKPWSTTMPASAAGVVALDFNKDNWMDLAFTHWAPPGISLWQNVEGKSFQRVKLPDIVWMRGWGIAPIDYDDDGWIDLVAVGEGFDGAGHIVLLRNEGSNGWRDVTKETGLDKVVLHNPRSVIACDFEGNGSTDLLITQNQLPPVLLKNIGGNKYNWAQIALEGSHDNKSGIGTKVYVIAGALRQKWEVPGASGYLGQGPLDILAGLDTEPAPDVVRLLWPTGVPQDELNVAQEKLDRITEIDRRGSSCPIVFVWNGEKFDFLADMIGPGIVGHWVGPHERDVPDPDEYFKVPGSDVATQNGRILFRMIEPMEELDYLDQVRLIAVDHPANVEVWPNERFASNPPFPKFKVITSENARPPLGAWDDHGRNLLPLLLKRDRKYVTDLPYAPYQGFAGMHSLTLDIGPWDPKKPLRLLMDGFTDYFTANSMYAAWQAGIAPVAPYVEALEPSGKWVRVVDDMGFPAGLARTMVADLTGKLPPGTRRIRITTNLKVYWDRIRIDNSPANLQFRTTEIPLADASLSFRGYPRVIEGNPKNGDPVNDIRYIYSDVSPTGPYTRQVGNYTRYGDVTPLVRDADDEYVIFGSGDEVAVSFDATRMPKLPAGWMRDYFFYANGFAKDMDFYAAYGDTVAPLPFHTLVPYPYPDGVGYPTDDRHLWWQLEYNTRGVAGPAGPVYLFQYPDSARH
jgi:tetratricopeptide (TPR) repeat protein